MDTNSHLQRALPSSALDALRVVGSVARDGGCVAYLVGGPLRDALLQRPIVDVDVSVEGDAIALAERIAARHDAVVDKTHEAFGTATVTFADGHAVDLATARAETYAEPAALPTVSPSSIGEDLLRRDFTINAMAAPIEGEGFGSLVDPCGGVADLDARRIRILHPGSFRDDPTRIFRACRFARRFAFTLDESTSIATRETVDGGHVTGLTGARARNEITAVLREAEATATLADLHEHGALQALATPFPFEADARDLVTRADALVPASEADRPRALLLAWFDALRVDWRPIARWLMAPAEVARDLDAISDVGEATGGRDPVTLRPSEWHPLLADVSADILPTVGARLGAEAHTRIAKLYREFADLRPLITGDDLRALGYEPGPRYSDVLQAALNAQLDGSLTDRDAALAFAQSRMRKLGGDLVPENA
ncbi:CCA tRNA nucleotidyltransferase [Candidatus Poribacteria bacterium]|nr:CCA tRNA nucleotidyltransferase [Candidatus Poribacteria bacterium]